MRASSGLLCRLSIDPAPISSQSTWFNPSVDAICLELPWMGLLLYSGQLYNPRRDMQTPDLGSLHPYANDTTYSEIVRSVLPFAKLAETVVVRPTRSLPSWKHDSVFPRLKAILVTVQCLDWDEDNDGKPLSSLPCPPCAARPVRLLDLYTTDFDDQVNAELASSTFLGRAPSCGSVARRCLQATGTHGTPNSQSIALESTPQHLQILASATFPSSI
ncbi:hypothetical protein F4778DRAFT_776179 [Xylariomycetidae sp. FL2044]|nr:hypothetical protein F4778DRAFT_776179 [Xylariomycetidae sp. FL2044]